MDAIGDDDPFTAKLSFEVRCLKSGKVLRGLVESHQYFLQTHRGPQLVDSFLWRLGGSETTSGLAWEECLCQ